MGYAMGSSTQNDTLTNATQNSAGSNTNSYSTAQSSLQNQLMQAFASMLPATANGGLSPNVQNMETANANQINENSQSVGTQMNRYLAARGFGKSGTMGEAAEQTQLGRASALGANASAASGTQLSFDQSLLSDSLAAAFTSMGSTATANSQNYSNVYGTGSSSSGGGGLNLTFGGGGGD